MALPTSGKISVRDIFIEMRQPERTGVGLNWLAREWFEVTGEKIFNSNQHKLSDWYGKIWPIPKEIYISEKSFKSTDYTVKGICSERFTTNYVKRWYIGKSPFSQGSKIYTTPDLSNYLGGPDRVGFTFYYLTKDGSIFSVNYIGEVSLIDKCPIISLSISPTEIERVPMTGGKYNISVVSNGLWTAKITLGGVNSSISSLSGKGNGTFFLTINPVSHKELYSPLGEVTVTSGDQSVILRWYRDDIILEPLEMKNI